MVQTLDISSSELERILVRCREEGTTLQGALLAAVLYRCRNKKVFVACRRLTFAASLLRWLTILVCSSRRDGNPGSRDRAGFLDRGTGGASTGDASKRLIRSQSVKGSPPWLQWYPASKTGSQYMKTSGAVSATTLS
jgi:hypothetical protein